MERNTEFTLLMAVYHQDNCLLFERAVRSVFANSVLPREFILVVDGPVEFDLAILILSLKIEFEINVIWQPTNLGLTAALNKGLQYVTSDWVLRADADDYNLPYRFEHQLNFIRSGIDLFGSAIVEVDKEGKNLGCRIPPCDGSEIYKFAKTRNPFNHMTVGFRLDLAKRSGGYPDIHLKEDYALWASMMMNGAVVANSPHVLVQATAGHSMYLRRGGWKYAKAEIDLQIHLRRCNIKGLFSAYVTGALRAFVFLIPGVIRGLIYQKILRY